MKFKVFIGAVLSAVMLCMTLTTQAATATVVPCSIVSPLYEIAHDAKSNLHISNLSAFCSSNMTSASAVKITAEQYLQKQGFLWIWTTYDGAEWTKTVNANVVSMYNTKSGLTKGKYRLKTIFTLTDNNGKTETITVYSYEVKVG